MFLWDPPSSNTGLLEFTVRLNIGGYCMDLSKLGRLLDLSKLHRPFQSLLETKRTWTLKGSKVVSILRASTSDW